MRQISTKNVLPTDLVHVTDSMNSRNDNLGSDDLSLDKI